MRTIFGYHTFRRGGLRLQIYYPYIRIKNKDITVGLDVRFRVAWGEYKALAVSCGFGIGFDYEKLPEAKEEIEIIQQPQPPGGRKSCP